MKYFQILLHNKDLHVKENNCAIQPCHRLRKEIISSLLINEVFWVRNIVNRGQGFKEIDREFHKEAKTWRRYLHYWRNTNESHDPETLAHLKTEFDRKILG